MTHHLITSETLGNQPDKVLFHIDPQHSAFPEFQQWATNNACRLSVGKDLMTLPKEKALEVVGLMNQKGWTEDTAEEISQRIVSVSNSRVMSIASREAAAAKRSSHHQAVNGKPAKEAKAAKETAAQPAN